MNLSAGFLAYIRVAEDRARAYRALAENSYNVCAACIRDCVVPVKDICCICITLRLLIGLLASPKTACLYRLHEGWNASEESVERYEWTLGFRMLSNCIVIMMFAECLGQSACVS